MSFKDILVIADTTPGFALRLDVALKLAARFDAHVTALFVRQTPSFPPFIEGQVAADFLEAVDACSVAAQGEAKAVFDEKASRYAKACWKQLEGDLVDEAVHHAMHADLTVVGQYNPDDPATDAQRNLCDLLLLDSGAPVLVLPGSAQVDTLGEQIVVGWNSSRESCRAVHDAMPLLKAAQRVEVIAVDDTRHDEKIRQDDAQLTIMPNLSHHGVKAEGKVVGDVCYDIGQTLLQCAQSANADLIVTGAWGRSRLREMVLGGVTSHLLRHAGIPILMSH
ncbi:universal stress protein [Haematospirillum sp. H1815]|uniref:universal stress protein n=1 Tax=Haematospirillum sp. H1815 TaxID=2723108 RepID=UPI00143B59FE|nr:universal stress protein [Haematospirillum sp. H1815]NKD77127.1 universal stress protein [Haematospirillum sp. H1815]